MRKKINKASNPACRIHWSAIRVANNFTI